MPRFVGKPIVVDAHLFTGITQDLPLSIAGQLSQTMVGERAYLSTTVEGDFVDGEVRYARADIVYPGDYIVSGPSGLYRMSPGEFDAAFEATDEPARVGNAARWQATYIGAGDGSTPAQLHWLGYRFPLGVPVGIDDPGHAGLVRQNAHFAVVDTAKALEGLTHAADGNATGGAGDPQTGLDGGSFGELADAPARRGPGRPRRTNYEGMRS